MPRLVLWLLLFLDEDGFVVMAPVCAMLGSMIGFVVLRPLRRVVQIYVFRAWLGEARVLYGSAGTPRVDLSLGRKAEQTELLFMWLPYLLA